MGQDVLVLGYTWTDGGVCLRVRTGWEVRTMPLAGRLSLRVTGVKRCTGYVDGELWPCPEEASPSGTQCEACQARDRFRPCMTCDGFRCPRLDPSARARCRQTHHLYLACFGDQTLKVGTAADARKEQRIIEQGPLAAARVARGEGPLIKQLEHLLAGEGFTETMRRSRKTALLRGSMTASEAEALVREAAETLPYRVPEAYHALLHPPEFVEQPELAVRSRALQVNTLPVEAGTTLEGDVVGAVGHVVFLEDGDGTFALDLGALRAHVVELDPEGPRRRPSVQLGLF